jgi:signal transduction histidine kinase
MERSEVALLRQLDALYVEDSDELREVTAQMLELFFNRVDTAADGAQALERFEAAREREAGYDIVISDINMPVMNGLELLGKIRDIDAKQPVIFITAFDEGSYLHEAIELHADGFLIKPLNPGKLKTTLVKIGKSIEAERAFKAYVKEIETLNATLMAQDHEADFNRLKEDMLRNLSHEIRTPLNSIMGMSQLMLKKVKDDEKLSAYAGQIHEGGQQIDRLTNRMMHLARLQSGSYKMEPSGEATHERLKERFGEFEALAAETGKQFEYVIDPVLKTPMQCDALILVTIVVELVDNAFKFSGPGASIKASVMADAQAQGFAIVVEDSGIGMTPEEVERAGEHFYQADTSTTRSSEGAGIGLGIVQSMSELANGEMSIASEPGKGTTVTVSLRFPEMGKQY